MRYLEKIKLHKIKLKRILFVFVAFILVSMFISHLKNLEPEKTSVEIALEETKNIKKNVSQKNLNFEEKSKMIILNISNKKSEVELTKSQINSYISQIEDNSKNVINRKDIREYTRKYVKNFLPLLKQILENPEALQSSLDTNLYIIKNELNLSSNEEFERFVSDYSLFYSKNMETYQECYRGIEDTDLKCILDVSYKFDQMENDLILEKFGRKIFELFLTKKIKRRSEYYAILNYIVKNNNL